MSKILNSIRNMFSKHTDEVDIVEDFYPVLSDMEAIAYEQFKAKFKEIAEHNDVSPENVVRFMMIDAGFNPRDQSKVGQFFWSQGLSQEKVSDLTNRYMTFNIGQLSEH